MKSRRPLASLTPMAVLLLMALSGCGGGMETPSVSQFAGSYRASYSRGDGSILIHVTEGGTVRAALLDGTDGASPLFYSGVSSTDSTGYATITCRSGMTSQTLILDGAFDRVGSGPPVFQGSLTSIPAGVSLPNLTIGLQGSSTVSPFVGPWKGSYLLPLLGRTQGTMKLTTASDGAVSGTLTDIEQGAVTVSGTMTSVGALSFSGTSSKGDVISFTGGFGFNSDGAKVGHGQWTSTAWPTGGTCSLVVGP